MSEANYTQATNPNKTDCFSICTICDALRHKSAPSTKLCVHVICQRSRILPSKIYVKADTLLLVVLLG